MADITAIGEVLIDLTQFGVNEAQVPLFAANPGGAPKGFLKLIKLWAQKMRDSEVKQLHASLTV